MPFTGPSLSSIHVLLVGNYEYDRQESMQRYAEMLAAGLPACGVTVELLKPVPRVGRLKPSAGGVGKWLGYIDKFLLFPFDLRQAIQRSRSGGKKVVVHICDHSNAMYSLHLAGVPNVVTCHDLLAVRSALGHFSENRIAWTGRRLQHWIIRGLRHAASIVCDSEATRRDLLALGGIAAGRATTLHIGLNHPYATHDEHWIKAALSGLEQVEQLGLRGYIFHVGGNQWYKNRESLLRIYFAYVKQGGRMPLVMAGKALPAALAAMVTARPEGANVIVLGNVSNDALNALYCRAACLLFPSLQEGFGWPVLEAMSAGCPVVCSARASLPEVGGEAAAYFNPDDEAEAVRQLTALLAEPIQARAARIQAGHAQADRFDTAKMLQHLVDHYQKLLAPGPKPVALPQSHV